METTKQNLIINKKTKNKRVKSNEIYLSSIVFSIFALLVFFERFFVLVFNSNVFIHFGIILMLLITLLIKPNKSNVIEVSITSIDLLWLVSIVIIQVYITFAGVIEYYDQFSMYGIGIMFLILAKTDIEKFRTSFLIIKFAAILYAFMSITHYLFTDLFHSVFFKFIPYVVQERMLELVTKNYYPGLAFAQPAIAAGYMIVGIGLILSFLEFGNKRGKFIDVIYIMLLLISVILVGKRSILLWGIITALVTYYILSTKTKKKARLFKLLLSFIIITFITYVIFIYFDSVEFFSRVVNTINGLIAGEDVTSGRTTLYTAAWELFKENPIFGIGWEQYAVITSGWFFSRDLSVHNVYLQLLSETGLVGFLAVVIPLLFVFYSTFKVLKMLIDDISDYNPLWKAGITFSFYFQLFFLLYSLTENPFYNTIYLLIYFYSIAIVNSFIVMHKIKTKRRDYYKDVIESESNKKIEYK